MLNTIQKSHYKLSIELHNKDIEIKKLKEKLKKNGSFLKYPTFLTNYTICDTVEFL